MRLSEVLVLNKFSSRYLVCYKDLNAHKTLHGGVLVRWMDEVSGMHARAITGGTCVTRLIDKISFVSKANAGDIMFIEILKASTPDVFGSCCEALFANIFWKKSRDLNGSPILGHICDLLMNVLNALQDFSPVTLSYTKNHA